MGNPSNKMTGRSVFRRVKASSAEWIESMNQQFSALMPKPKLTPSDTSERLSQIVRSTAGVSDTVASALLEVPRLRFIPKSMQEHAFVDGALPIGESQTISQPSLVAVMISLLQIEPGRTGKVLDVGCGSGYTSAILSKLASHVVAVERIESLATLCDSRLKQLGFTNVEVVLAKDDELGHSDGAPYDAILVSAGAPYVPPSLSQQLAPDSRMVIPVGDRTAQRLAVVTRQGTSDEFVTTYHQGCRFVPLIGPDAWSD